MSEEFKIKFTADVLEAMEAQKRLTQAFALELQAVKTGDALKIKSAIESRKIIEGEIRQSNIRLAADKQKEVQDFISGELKKRAEFRKTISEINAAPKTQLRGAIGSEAYVRQIQGAQNKMLPTSNEFILASELINRYKNTLKQSGVEVLSFEEKLGRQLKPSLVNVRQELNNFTGTFATFSQGTQGGISGISSMANSAMELAGSLSPATVALGGVGAVIGIMIGEVYLGVKAFETFISTYEKLSDLALQGAEFTELRKHFDDINGGAEIGKEKLLEFQHAADNHLNNEELIKFANTEKEANLNTDESIQLLDLATRKHHELGKTIEETNQAFLKYLQTGTTRGLATVLNVPELKKAQEDIAKSYKMIFSKLDEESQARIRKIALLQIEGKTVDEIKNKELTHAGVISTLKTEYANLMLNAKALLSEGFTPLASGVNKLVEKLKDMGAKIIEQLGGIDHIKAVMIDWAKRITDYIMPILEKFITKIGNVISSIIEFAKRNTILIQGFEELGRIILKTVDMIGTGLQAVISSTITAIKFMIDSVIGGFVLLLKGANMIKSLVGGDTQAGDDLISQLESLKSDTGAGTHIKKSGQPGTVDDFSLKNKDKSEKSKKEKEDAEEDLLAILKDKFLVTERDHLLTNEITGDFIKQAKVIEQNLRNQLALTTTYKEQNLIQKKITDAVNFELELVKKMILAKGELAKGEEDTTRQNLAFRPDSNNAFNANKGSLQGKPALPFNFDKLYKDIKGVGSSIGNIMNTLGVKTDSFVGQLISGFNATLSIVDSIANILSSIISGSGSGGIFSDIFSGLLSFIPGGGAIAAGIHATGAGHMINNYRPSGNGRMTQPIYIMGTMSGQTFMRVESSKYANRMATKAV